MRYLVTGHTGFKGSWLSLMLKHLGHEVSGISLNPEEDSLFESARLSEIFSQDSRVDIRDIDKLTEAVISSDPEVIIHLAAQPLVRYSYLHPVETFETNVIGTLNVLEASRNLSNLKAVLIITTDKVYKNFEYLRGYKEDDALGGQDPYSASKSAADIATQSWVDSFAKVPVAIARAGNVVGGGDWSQDRLVPDLVKAYRSNRTPVIRNPESIRPWQHVLDCLNGYLLLVESMLSKGTGGSWNFGPDHTEIHKVNEVINSFSNHFKHSGPAWGLDQGENPPESHLLLLDSSKARTQLRWKDFLSFEETMKWTAEWYSDVSSNSARTVTQEQISRFFSLSDAE